MTTIRSAVYNSDRTVSIKRLGTERVGVVTTRGLGAAANAPDGLTVEVDRAEFLAAVATELDVLIIPRTDLPKVTDDGVDLVAHGNPLRGVADDVLYDPNTATRSARSLALAYLALAEYLDAHPPIDQAQVDALAQIITDEGLMPTGLSYTEVARRLIATGRVTITPDGGAS